MYVRVKLWDILTEHQKVLSYSTSPYNVAASDLLIILIEPELFKMILVGDQGNDPYQHIGHGFTDQSASLAEYSPENGKGARIQT